MSKDNFVEQKIRWIGIAVGAAASIVQPALAQNTYNADQTGQYPTSIPATRIVPTSPSRTPTPVPTASSLLHPGQNAECPATSLEISRLYNLTPFNRNRWVEDLTFHTWTLTLSEDGPFTRTVLPGHAINNYLQGSQVVIDRGTLFYCVVPDRRGRIWP